MAESMDDPQLGKRIELLLHDFMVALQQVDQYFPVKVPSDDG